MTVICCIADLSPGIDGLGPYLGQHRQAGMCDAIAERSISASNESSCSTTDPAAVIT
jgi:hypothetical protein